MSSDPVAAANGINSANKDQTSLGLIIQTYSNSVKEQPSVDFGGQANLASYQTQINAGLATAKAHADTYLTTIQPNIVLNISNIGNFYALNSAVATTLPAGSTTAQWVESLTVLQTQSTAYQTAANGVVISLKTLLDDMTTDTAAFATTVTELNTAVNGDNGVLASDAKELSDVQGKIDGAIAGIVTSGLAVIGGVFMIAVGGIADFVTAGASTPLVVGGVGILLAGVGGEVASAITLASLSNEKNRILNEESTLTAEVALAIGISGGYQSLMGQVKSAVDAASKMQNAWEFLSGDLGNMVSDLNSGIQSADQIRELFLTAANSEVKQVITDITTIKAQMAGVTSIVAKPGQTVAEALLAAANAPSLRKVA